MTEAEWLASQDDPLAMVQWLHEDGLDPRRDKPLNRDRKFRLFACACCRRAWDRLSARGRKAIEIAERYAVGLATEGENMDAHFAAFPEDAPNSHPHDPQWLGVWATANRTGGMFEANFGLRLRTLRENGCTAQAQADLLRHIIGNPFRPPVTKPCPACKGEGRVTFPDQKPRGPLSGNPYMVECFACRALGYLPVPLPDHWPGDVVELARACVEEPACDGCRGNKTVVLFRGPGATNPYHADCADCGGKGVAKTEPPYFALHDALLDVGLPELAGHFAGEKCVKHSYEQDQIGGWFLPPDCQWCQGTGMKAASHPKGCWALDLILGQS